MSSVDDAARQAARVRRALMRTDTVFQTMEAARQVQMALCASSVFHALENVTAMQRALLDSPAFRAIEHARQMQKSFAKLEQSLIPQVPTHLQGLDMTVADMCAMVHADPDPQTNIRRVVVTRTAGETNQYLNAGWTLIEARLTDDDSAGEGVWMLGWCHADEPSEPGSGE